MSIVFHKQLASIMEVLTAAAVAEISKLVDDGYAVLHLEMSQHVKEKEALKKKLRVMELRNSPSNSRHLEVQVRHESRGTKESSFEPAASGSHAGGRNTPVLGASAPDQPTISTRKLLQCADREERRTEALLIKEEREEEDRGPRGEMDSREERSVEWRASSRKKRPVQEPQNKPANHTEELTEQHRTRRAVWEVSGLESPLKAEGETECVDTAQHRGTERRAEGLNALDSEFVMYERPGQLGSYCTQGGAVSDTEDPCCSYSTETESQSFHSESTKDDTGHTSLSVSSHDVKPEVPVDTVSFKIEADIDPTWDEGGTSEGPESELVYTERPHCAEDRGGQAAQVDNVYILCLPYNQTAAKGSVATAPKSNPGDVNGTPPFERRYAASEGFRTLRKACTRKRKFICKYCGKGFPRAKELDIHQRVHTGEKPFSCTHCGKRFTQKCNLKTHLSIHTGEKPFRCLQCGKRFVQSGYLKAHQRVHTGEKPFSCVKCGKRFGQSSYLRSHQSVHTGEKPFSCAHCGKCFTRSCHLKRHQSVHVPGGNCTDVNLYL